MAARRSLLLSGLALTALLAGPACSDDGADKGEPASSAPVSLGYDGPEGLTIGVITSSTGTGASVRPLATGARLAEYRLDGLDATSEAVDLVVADDRGDADSAVSAVEEMVGSGVAGIVYASTGDHVGPALAEAERAGVPVLLPYAEDATVVEGAGAAWVTGVTGQAAARAVMAHLEAADLDDVTILLTGDDERAGLDLLEGTVVRLRPGADGTYDDAITEADLDGSEAAVVWTSATPGADVVAALQRADLGLPIITAPTALEPAFADGLAALQEESGLAAIDASVLSVGPAVTDFDPDSNVDAFIQALRVGLDDEALTGLDETAGTFAESESVGSLDTGAHDAVLYLAAAATAAGSTDPAEVASALAELDAGAVAGRVGPEIDPDRPEGLPDEAVTMLRSDAYTGGPRADLSDRPTISWFRVETTG
ncbi:MAG TPA: ABC transporter substrate-binding protein [Iamia sp.]|nr:ABC transporter substrate-binding protein [Iamia sp.]